MARAAYCPIWIATGQTPGRMSDPLVLNAAASPRTKTSGWPGMVQSGSTMARPALSSGVPSVLSSGLALFPAAQITVWVGITQPAAVTDPGRMSVTSVWVRTSTPSLRSSSLASSLRLGG